MLVLPLLIAMLLQVAVSLGERDSGLGRHRHRRYPPGAHIFSRGQDDAARPTRTSTTTITLYDCETTSSATLARLSSRETSAAGNLSGPASSDLSSSILSSTGTNTQSFAPVTSTVSVITSTTSSAVVQILPSSQAPTTTGTIQTTLQTEGHITEQPIMTSSIPSPQTLIQTAVNSSTPTASPTTTIPTEVQNIFAQPIATDAPPSAIKTKQDHPARRKGIDSSGPLQTNKFYSNFFLGDQHCPTFLFPYSVAWAKGSGSASSWGLAISHVESSQRDFGKPEPVTGARKYYINPVGIQSVVLSAVELGANTALTSHDLTDTSVRICLRSNPGDTPAIQFPLMQGSAFITALYGGTIPLIQTGIYFKTVTRSTQEVKPGVTKFKLHLEDDSVWLLYATHTNGSAPLDLQVINNGVAQARSAFHGIIQVAKDPGNADVAYDAACGAYPMGFDLAGSVHEGRGEYSFRFRKGGMANVPLALFALPHHQSSFGSATREKMTQIKLDTPTKGVAALVLADEWTMVEEQLPVSVGFLPWSPEAGTVRTLSEGVRVFVHNITVQELSQNMVMQSNQDSMYFSGKVCSLPPPPLSCPLGMGYANRREKALAKFATIALAAHDLLRDKPLAVAGLAQLKIAFARFSENQQQYPLVYECMCLFFGVFLVFVLTINSRLGGRCVVGILCDGGCGSRLW